MRAEVLCSASWPCLILLLANLSLVCSVETFCRGMQNLSDSSGEIVSYSEGNNLIHYMKTICYWQINVPTGYRVAAWFTRSDWYIHMNSHDSGKVTLYDGFDGLSAIATVGTYEAPYASPRYVSTSNTMTVHFYFDGYVGLHKNGFRLRYEATNSSENANCGRIQFTNPSNTSGVISSHDSYGSMPYSPNMSCSWTLSERPGHSINFSIANMSIGAGDCVTFIDNAASGNRSNTSYCGWRALTGLWLQMTAARIVFSSNGQFESTGFHIHFSYETLCQGYQYLSDESVPIVSHIGVGRTYLRKNVTCYWQISAPRGRRVAAWFTYVNLHGCCDVVKFYDGIGNSTVIATISSYASSSPISPSYVSSSSILTIYFRTGSSSRRSRGFRLKFNFTESPIRSTCGSVRTTNSSDIPGLINSHDSYGSTPYSPNMSCSWTLHEMSGRYIHLSFTKLSLGNGDCLRLTSNSSNKSYCGWTAVPGLPLRIEGDAHIMFSSDGRYESDGFQISFYYETFCSGTQYLKAGSGEIRSHTGVGLTNLMNNMNCSWYITAPPGKQVSIRFTYISHSWYSYDRVTLSDVYHSTIDTLYSSISFSTSRAYESTSNILKIDFLSGDSRTSRGFKLQYSTVENYCYGFKNISEKSGEISSHNINVDSKRYLKRMSCYWQINAPPGYRVSAWLTHRSTYYNTITLYDGVNGSSILSRWNSYSHWRKWDLHVSAKFVSSSSTMTVYYQTGWHIPSYSYGSNGFRMQYRVTKSSKNNSCRSINFTNPSNTSGVISSHDRYGSTLYSPNMSCSWTLPELSGLYVHLLITNMSLGDGDCVTITGKATSGSSSNISYCGWKFVSYLTLPLADAQISFSSNNRSESLGFLISFRYEASCSGIQYVTSEHGEITINNGVNGTHYPNGMNCVWNIIAPPGKKVMAWFTLIDLHSYADAIILYDGTNGSRTLATVADRFEWGRYTRASDFLSQLFVSSLNIMSVQFSSDSRGTAFGFKLKYTSANDFCHGYRSLTAESGEIVSHRGVNSTSYFNHMYCQWQIIVPPGNAVVVRFTYISLRQYNFDRITLSDGMIESGYSSGNIMTVSESSYGLRYFLSRPFSSSSNAMLIAFKTGGYGFGPHLGFRLQYSTVERYCSGNKFLTSKRGKIASHVAFGKDKVLSNMECYWKISVPTGHRINASFSYINVSGLDEVTMTIFDGDMDDSTVLSRVSGRYASQHIPSEFLSTSNSMTVYFRTWHYASSSLGFQLEYNSIDNGSFCQGFQMLSAGKGEIASHNGAGESHFAAKMSCYWQITAERSARVFVEVAYRDSESHSDAIDLIDGINKSILATVRAGDGALGLSFNYTAPSNIMVVRFSAYGNGTSRGFRLRYKSTTEI